MDLAYELFSRLPKGPELDALVVASAERIVATFDELDEFRHAGGYGAPIARCGLEALSRCGVSGKLLATLRCEDPDFLDDLVAAQLEDTPLRTARIGDVPADEGTHPVEDRSDGGDEDGPRVLVEDEVLTAALHSPVCTTPTALRILEAERPRWHDLDVPLQSYLPDVALVLDAATLLELLDEVDDVPGAAGEVARGLARREPPLEGTPEEVAEVLRRLGGTRAGRDACASLVVALVAAGRFDDEAYDAVFGWGDRGREVAAAIFRSQRLGLDHTGAVARLLTAHVEEWAGENTNWFSALTPAAAAVFADSGHPGLAEAAVLYGGLSAASSHRVIEALAARDRAPAADLAHQLLVSSIVDTADALALGRTYGDLLSSAVVLATVPLGDKAWRVVLEGTTGPDGHLAAARWLFEQYPANLPSVRAVAEFCDRVTPASGAAVARLLCRSDELLLADETVGLLGADGDEEGDGASLEERLARRRSIVQTIVERLPGLFDALCDVDDLEVDPVLLDEIVRCVVAGCQQSPARWEAALSLSATWEGTAPGLFDAAGALAGDPRTAPDGAGTSLETARRRPGQLEHPRRVA